MGMSLTHSFVTTEVRRYMDASHITQAAMGRALGISQSQVSARLQGRVRWSVDDIDRLTAVGVPIAVVSTEPWEAQS